MTVTASQAIDAARPLKVEPVNKPKVWAVGLFSATLLFLFTIAAENNEAWFPAISKANKAMNISKKQAQVRDNHSGCRVVQNVVLMSGPEQLRKCVRAHARVPESIMEALLVCFSAAAGDGQ